MKIHFRHLQWLGLILQEWISKYSISWDDLFVIPWKWSKPSSEETQKNSSLKQNHHSPGTGPLSSCSRATAWRKAIIPSTCTKRLVGVTGHLHLILSLSTRMDGKNSERGRRNFDQQSIVYGSFVPQRTRGWWICIYFPDHALHWRESKN